CRMLAVIAAAVALVAAARIAIVGARGTRGALRVGRTRGARSRAQLCGIALAGRGAAERRGGEEGVGGTGGTGALAGLGRVAVGRCGPAYCPRVARRVPALVAAAVALVAAAEETTGVAGGPVGLPSFRRL